MKTKEYFISGIDTSCGKTYVTGILALKLKAGGKKIITSKLVQTGCKGMSEDILEHRKLMKTVLFPEDLSGITCPYVLSYPASPHLAAKIDNKAIDIRVLRKSAKTLMKKYEIVLTEGAGGLMVPITKKYSTINYISDNKLPLILVASSKLGSINHTLLSLELCFNQKIDLQLVVYNKLPGNNEIIANDTYSFLAEVLENKFPRVRLIHSKELEETPINEFSLFEN